MKGFTKKDLLMVLNVYQNYNNEFVNISDKDLNIIYLKIAIEDIKEQVSNINIVNK